MTLHTFWYLEALEAVSGALNSGTTPPAIRRALRATVGRLALPPGLTRDNFGLDEVPFLFDNLDPALALSSLWFLGLALGTSVVSRGLLGPRYSTTPFPARLEPGLLVGVFMALAPLVLCSPATAGAGSAAVVTLTSLMSVELSYYTRGCRADYLTDELGPLGHDAGPNLPGPALGALPDLGWLFPLAR